MTSRLPGLTEVDPRAVPLPHGTEVTTRVERHLHGRRVPQGLVGRVVRARDGGFDVLITGVGELWFERDELAPRKGGQLEYAQRREQAWQALWPCRVVEATVGSRAWGLAEEGSDTDLRGAFALPLPWSQGLVDPPTDLVSADGSQTYWELRKLVGQALRADPNTFELLFLPSVQALDEVGAWLLEVRDAFPSRLLFGSFGRYALSQLDKLSAAQRLAVHRDTVLDWLAGEPTLTLDQVAARLAALDPREGRPGGDEDAVHRTKLYLKQLYRSLADQGLLEHSDFDSLRRYATSGGRRPPDARALRPKNAYNLLRLLRLATDWLTHGTPTFEASGAFRERLLTIKHGEVALDDVLEEARAMAPALEAARDHSPLPEQPDFQRADAFLQRAGQELARRFVHRVPGPFGADAPAAPRPNNNVEAGHDIA
jgi:hypothetical protein